ncbi:DUF2058 domain-containing protein [Pseudomarimonas arenosa]|uniref:DUF2058 domain-containing protein n=1 Tax=Pseudomarimonas arenosa TaxID=2774145 RepID=A0AAW3ZJI8_9GAMM|nr:DUF2058 domain-containing protein [Pseudomarimonas arenosa]MBD8524621.1 DUF2058 domain-containing protein [Pseudomarimonas arenosa]
MRNALQEQLLKAGLAKKSKIDAVAREQAKQRSANAAAPSAEQAEAERQRREKAERDRQLQAERNAQARIQEQRAQARQIIEQNKLKLEGDSDYRFTDGNAIRSILVTDSLRKQLAKGSVVIVRFDDSYAVVPRAVVEKIESRDAGMIVVDHGRGGTAGGGEAEDEYYKRFVVPDDLVW